MNLKEKKNNENKKLSKQLEQEESEKWTSHGGISVGRGKGPMGEKGTGKKKHNWLA